MSEHAKTLTPHEQDEAKARRVLAMHLQEIESNPLNPDQVKMFEMFEREGWSHERRLAYVRERAKNAAMIHSAE